MTQNTEQERQGFEAWYAPRLATVVGESLKRHLDTYWWGGVAEAWEVWQAARRAPVMRHTSTEQEREAFEAAYIADKAAKLPGSSREFLEKWFLGRSDEEYGQHEANAAWWAWQESAARRAPAVPETIEQRAKKLKGLQVLIGATAGVPEAIELARSRFTEAYGRSPLHDDLAYACLLIDAYGGAPAVPGDLKRGNPATKPDDGPSSCAHCGNPWGEAAPVPQVWKITEEMHIAAVKVLRRASGIDGLPQRMVDAMLAAAPQPQEIQPNVCKTEIQTKSCIEAEPVQLPEPDGLFSFGANDDRPSYHHGQTDKQWLNELFDKSVTGGPYRSEFAYSESKVLQLLTAHGVQVKTAAPQPPEAAPVQMPDPWGVTVGDHIWVGCTPAHVPKLAEHEGLPIRKLDTEQQVLAMLTKK